MSDSFNHMTSTKGSIDSKERKIGGSRNVENVPAVTVGYDASIFSPGDGFWNEALEACKTILLRRGAVELDASPKVEPRATSINSRRTNLSKDDGVRSPLPVKKIIFPSVAETDAKSTATEIVQWNRGIEMEQSEGRTKSHDALNNLKVETSGDRLAEPLMAGPIHKDQKLAVKEESQVMDELNLQLWLPAQVCQVYAKKGVSRMYPWQVSCLRTEGVLAGRNLVYSASTSAGKSLVAEIVLLRRLMMTGRKGLMVLPYVSLCAEKSDHMDRLLAPIGKRVGRHFGSEGGGGLKGDEVCLAVCTIEKANSLVNKLLEDGRMSEIAVVVVDELHMVGDSDRGYLLELLLTKLRYAAGLGEGSKKVAGSSISRGGKAKERATGGSSGSSHKSESAQDGLQIVGMSATMPNVAAISKWLNAGLFETAFRPVPLEEFIKVGPTIHTPDLTPVRSLPPGSDLLGKDPDHVVELCHEVVQAGHSVLIFCPSRLSCESVARHVARLLPRFQQVAREDSRKAEEPIDLETALQGLRKGPSGLCGTLEETLPLGVAYHHAGLTVEERELIESCFRQGLVRVLTATSTLAAGVNLPARRVIFRGPKIGRDFIDATKYRQMAGRAGRAGIDDKGQSIMICKAEEVKRVTEMMSQGSRPLESCLAEERNGCVRALMEVVASGMVQTAGDVNRYVRCTMLCATKPFEEVVKSAQESLRWLCQQRFLEWDEGVQMYSATPLGKATFASSLTPEECLQVFADLAKAREGLVLANDLHLLYLVTPVYIDLEPDWSLFYSTFVGLPQLQQAVGLRVGVQEPFLMRMAHGGLGLRVGRRGRNDSWNRSAAGPSEETLRVCKRFFVSLILNHLVQEHPLSDICATFRVPRGTVQGLQEASGRFASMVSAFCEKLGWTDLQGLISSLQARVSFGVRSEIVELTEIPFVKAARARALYRAGLRGAQAVALASVEDIAKAIADVAAWAQQDGRSARLVAGKIRNGARKVVLDKAEEARVQAFTAFRSLGVSPPKGSPSASLPPLPGGSNRKTAGKREASGAVVEEPKRQKVEPKGPVVLPGPERCVDRGLTGGECGAAVLSSSAVDGKGFCPVLKRHAGPVDVDKMEGGMDAFLALWRASERFVFDFFVRFDSCQRRGVVGGLAVCWQGSPVYYVNISRPNKYSESQKEAENLPEGRRQVKLLLERWEAVSAVLRQPGSLKCGWDLKEQLKQLGHPMVEVDRPPGQGAREVEGDGGPAREKDLFGYFGGAKSRARLDLPALDVGDPMVDVRILTWILSPDEESEKMLHLEQVVKKRLSAEAAAVAQRDGRWASMTDSVVQNGCCRRAAQVRALMEASWKRLPAEALQKPLQTIEMPLVRVLGDMEGWGVGIDMLACIQHRQMLEKKVQEIESRANVLAGQPFLLSNPAEVSHLLYKVLKLPEPAVGGGKQRKGPPSTDKQTLESLKSLHPVVALIRQHRTLSKLMSSTIGSIMSHAKPIRQQGQGQGQGAEGRGSRASHVIHGTWLHTATATGRLSMEEPNLQCVEREIVVESEEEGQGAMVLNPRSIFVASQEGWVMVAADYSQIEVRLMAHFSGDEALCRILSDDSTDLFSEMAAKWRGVALAAITKTDRESAKKLVYGILYGMGVNSLAEKMDCNLGEASSCRQKFLASFPGVSRWLDSSVEGCRRKGYVSTLAGRRRYLEGINNASKSDQSRAARQAVNSICQGSAADLIKRAMIDFHSAITGKGCGDSEALVGKCRLLLQIHDELVIEVDRRLVKEAVALLRRCMEGSFKLRVALKTKVKVGPSWGSLEDYE